MKYRKIFEKAIGCKTEDEVFDYLMTTLKQTVSGWDYFVNWSKVLGNIKDIEVELNILNYLVGKDHIEEEFARLLEKYPQVARLVPVLVACRQARFDLLTTYGRTEFTFETFDFAKPGGLEIGKVVEFAKGTGFLELLTTQRVQSIVDYVIGVEVGLDSNGRKNRRGKTMEAIVEFFVRDICDRGALDFLPEASASKVREKWGLNLRVDKSSRRVDFVINNCGHLFLIETNFYGGGGSKLKATAGEYKAMHDFWTKDGHDFIWITDGCGWESTRLPLRETFNHIDYLLNLEMVSKGVLEGLVLGGR